MKLPFPTAPIWLGVAMAGFGFMLGMPSRAADLPPQQGGATAVNTDEDQAIAALTQVITAQPNDLQGYFKRALLYIQEGQNDLALADLNKVIELAPQYAPGFVRRAYLYMLEDDNEHALSDLNQALQLDPRTAEAYFHRSFVYLTKKFDDQALADLNQVIQIDPQFTQAYFRRARVNMVKGFYDRSIADFQQVIQLDPKNVQAYNALAWLLATCPQPTLRDGAKAVGYATTGCELTQWTSAQMVDTLAAAYATAGDFQSAIKWETKFLAMTHLDTGSSTGGQGRLALYQSHQAYHVDKYELQLFISN
jgi:tetratricopeptide (TPR) repeat protein